MRVRLIWSASVDLVYEPGNNFQTNTLKNIILRDDLVLLIIIFSHHYILLDVVVLLEREVGFAGTLGFAGKTTFETTGFPARVAGFGGTTGLLQLLLLETFQVTDRTWIRPFSGYSSAESQSPLLCARACFCSWAHRELDHKGFPQYEFLLYSRLNPRTP